MHFRVCITFEKRKKAPIAFRKYFLRKSEMSHYVLKKFLSSKHTYQPMRAQILWQNSNTKEVYLLTWNCFYIQLLSSYFSSVKPFVTMFAVQYFIKLSRVCDTHDILLTWVFPLPVWPYAKHVAIPWLKIVSTSGFAVYLRYDTKWSKCYSKNDLHFHK